jgi:hypothetical protein
VLLGQASLEEGAGVDPRRGVALEVDEVPRVILAPAAKEVVEGHLVEGRRRRVGGDVTADALGDAVGADHHGHGVPANDALDPALDLPAAGVGHLLGRMNGVDVGRFGGEGEPDARAPGVDVKGLEEGTHALGSLVAEHPLQRIQPLPGFQARLVVLDFRAPSGHARLPGPPGPVSRLITQSETHFFLVETNLGAHP